MCGVRVMRRGHLESYCTTPVKDNSSKGHGIHTFQGLVSTLDTGVEGDKSILDYSSISSFHNTLTAGCIY